MLLLYGSFTTCNSCSYEVSDKLNRIDQVNSLCIFYLSTSSPLPVIRCIHTLLHREEKQHIKLPRSLEDAKQLGLVLTRYRKDYYAQVLAAVSLVYILYPFTLFWYYPPSVSVAKFLNLCFQLTNFRHTRFNISEYTQRIPIPILHSLSPCVFGKWVPSN